jgi:hypothetical protein
MYTDALGFRRWMLAHPIGTNRLAIFFFSALFHCSSMAKKVLLEFEVELDPQVPLAKRDEGRDMLNPIRI